VLRLYVYSIRAQSAVSLVHNKGDKNQILDCSKACYISIVTGSIPILPKGTRLAEKPYINLMQLIRYNKNIAIVLQFT
jgi:hypothetical protein